MVLYPSDLRRILKYQNIRHKPASSTMVNNLTLRELQILRLVAKGANNKEIAQKMGLSVRTIKGHLLTLFARLDARSRTEAVVIGLRTGILTIDDVVK